MSQLIKLLKETKIVPAIKTPSQLENAVESKAKVLFLLKSNISEVKNIVDLCHSRGKRVFVHLDLLEGLANDDEAVKYVSEVIRPDGIISTKNSVIKSAKQYGMFCVFRVFLIDSHSVQTALVNAQKNKADAVEILPGILPEMIDVFKKETGAEVITGGLISSQKHIDNAIAHGAICCSVSKECFWCK